MRNSLLKAGVAAAALLILPANGYAACATSGASAQSHSSTSTMAAGTTSNTTAASDTEVKSNNETVEQIVDNAKVDPETGHVEASTGAAKPTETWMGCPPDNDEPRCETPEGQAQLKQEAESKAVNDGTNADGDIDAKAGLRADAKASIDQACADEKTAG